MSDTDHAALLQSYLNATIELVRGEHPDLTDRQKAVLLSTYLKSEAQTVRGLSAMLKVAKPAISRAIDRLSEFDLIRREVDPTDRRSVILIRTATGSEYVRSLGAILASAR